jgi:hypothetical protein
LALFFDTDKLTPEQTEWFRSLMEDLNRKTLGQLLRSIKNLVTHGDDILKTWDEALAKRNYLMHRFFPFHIFALFSVEGRREMLAELDEIRKKLYVAHVMLNGLHDTLHMLAGRSLEEQDRVHQRLLAQGRRVICITNEPDVAF